LVDGEHVTVMAEVVKVQGRALSRKPGHVTEVTVTDGTGELRLSYFGRRAGVGAEKKLPPGTRGLFAGKISSYQQRNGVVIRQLADPEFELMPAGLDDAAARQWADELIPIYPATKGLQSWDSRECVGMILD